MKKILFSLMAKQSHEANMLADRSSQHAILPMTGLSQEQLVAISGGDSPSGTGVGAGDGPKANW